MDKTLANRITLNEYTIAKKEFEIASLYLSDTYNYVPIDLQYDVRAAQAILVQLAQVMQDLINNIENSGQPEKNKEEKENG